MESRIRNAALMRIWGNLTMKPWVKRRPVDLSANNNKNNNSNNNNNNNNSSNNKNWLYLYDHKFIRLVKAFDEANLGRNTNKLRSLITSSYWLWTKGMLQGSTTKEEKNFPQDFRCRQKRWLSRPRCGADFQRMQGNGTEWRLWNLCYSGEFWVCANIFKKLGNESE